MPPLRFRRLGLDCFSRIIDAPRKLRWSSLCHLSPSPRQGSRDPLSTPRYRPVMRPTTLPIKSVGYQRAPGAVGAHHHRGNRANRQSSLRRNKIASLRLKGGLRWPGLVGLAIAAGSLSAARAFSTAAMPGASGHAGAQLAVVYRRNEAEGIKVESKPLPSFNHTKKGNNLLCKVAYAGINPVDAKGLVGDKLPEWCSSSLSRMGIEGRTVGFDFSGTVVSVPLGCQKFKPGDSIYGTMPPGVGSFCEMVVAPIDQVALKPQSLSFQEAAALPLVGLTSLQALVHDNGLRSGQHLLLIGASGGVGHVALQVAKAVGAKVTAICSARNADFVQRLGADAVIDYTRGDMDEQLKQAVGRRGVFDLCFDTVSSLDEKDRVFKYQESIRGAGSSLLAGKYVTIGGRPMDWAMAGLKRTIGLSLFPKDRELFWVRFPASAEALKKLSEMCDEGRLRPVIGAEVLLQDGPVRNAFASLHARRTVGKLVIKSPQ